MPLVKPAIALIDLDGTLIDSVPDLAYCVNQVVSELDLPARSEAQIRTWVGNGVKALIKRAVTGEMDGEPSNDLFEQALSGFLELYQHNASTRSQLYPAVIEGLQWLQNSGIRLGCVTNKDARFTLPILDKFGLSDYFEIVISGDRLPVKKPDPAPLFYGAGFFDCRPENALMIGDSRSDVTASRAAGFQIICMSYGYNHGEDIRLANPDAVIDSFAELPDTIETA